MRARDLDRGMRAVARVRSVRERDSRLGLQQALQESEARRLRMEQLSGGLAATPSWAEGSATDFVAGRARLLAVGEAVARATDEWGSAQRIADTARAHWTADHVRLTAVESLLEQRQESRRAERAHCEAAELDDVAAQLWTRAHRTLSSPLPARTDLEEAR